MLRILIVDDHILMRTGLVSLFDGQPDFEVLGQAGSVEEAVVLTRELQPDLILMDFGLPDGTGLDATKAILAIQPDAKIVFLTVHEQDDLLFEAIRAGAKGYLLKNVRPQSLLSFLRGVQQGEPALTPAMTSRILDDYARSTKPSASNAPELNLLSVREREVAELLADGATNREIAERLVISENTVKNHVRNILGKLKLRNRREVANLLRKGK
jgi:two-component system NarL family response regulator